MKTLFWVPPWIAHGDPLFFRNCLRKHLLPQANVLANAGFAVDFVLPELLSSERSRADSKINIIDLDAAETIALTGSTTDPTLALYEEHDELLLERIASRLLQFLAPSYDCILLWETPVPFLERMYPDALIVHQMPGAFSRAPFPHTVTFDPAGLYKRSTLFLDSATVKAGQHSAATTEMVRCFTTAARSTISRLQPFSRTLLNPKGTYSKLTLVPLQVSAHYSFQADTCYGSQADFLLHVLSETPEDTGVVVTQYVTPRVQDAVLNADLVAALKKKWPNLVFSSEFDRVSSVSQYLAQLVDEVCTCSSSIGIQSMIWGRSMRVPQPTFLAPFATADSGLTTGELQQLHVSTLGFVLGRQQPLASKIVDDAGFLIPLLEELVARKRAGLTGVEALPAFESIDPEYAQRLIESFKADRAAKELGQASEVWSAQQSDAGKFRRALDDSNIKAVSFDVFDTLIRRPTEVPADVYKFLEQRALALSEGLAGDFAKVRLNAEVQTREKLAPAEITLNDIYATLASHYGFDGAMTERLKRLEIEAEIAFMQPRVEGRKLWNQAMASRRPVYAISDMYLPHEVVQAMLTKAGYSGYRKLFVSSVYGVRKKEGGLFDVVLAELGLAASSLLHVGDNKVADVEQPQQRGIKTHRLLRAVDRLRGNALFKEIYPPRAGAGEKARSAIAGLTAHALFDSPSGSAEKETHFQGSPYNLGYAALGPIVTGYMLWLGRQAHRDGISRLYFLSREGWLLRQVYDALNSGRTETVPSSYLYASRRATRVASLRSDGDVLALAGHPFRAGVEVGALLVSRFGLSLTPRVCAAIVEAGYGSAQDPLLSDQGGRVRFAGLCRSLSREILEIAEEERDAYLAHLQGSGFVDEVRPAVVDLGWRANMQGALGQLIGRPLDGYYYATLQGAEGWVMQGHRMWAYAGDLLSVQHPSAVVANRQFAEFLVCHTEPSLLRMQRTAADVKPLFRPEAELGRRRLLIDEVHQGALQFALDMSREYASVMSEIWIDWSLAERVFASFVNAPSRTDALLLVGHHFEDAIGGIARQYVISPRPKASPADSVWKAGATVVHAARTGTSGAERVATKRAPDKPNQTTKLGSVVEPRSALNNRVRWLEAKVVKRLVSPRKFQKYLRDRFEFFADSKSHMAKTWIRLVA